MAQLMESGTLHNIFMEGLTRFLELHSRISQLTR